MQRSPIGKGGKDVEDRGQGTNVGQGSRQGEQLGKTGRQGEQGGQNRMSSGPTGGKKR